MLLSEMFTLLNQYVDDVVDTTNATLLLNAGQNLLAVDKKATFPQLVASTLNGTFIFPAKYHEAPVLYAAAMIKATDSSVREKESFLSQFHSFKADFTENYDVPMQYMDDINVQQFIAVDTQTAFVVTKDTYNNPYSRLKVYLNGNVVRNFTLPSAAASASTIVTNLTYSNDPNSFTLAAACVAGDLVTAWWEIHDEYVEPPVPWWSAW